MNARISDCFTKLRAQKRSAFIPFIMGGDPDIEKSTQLLLSLPDSGADMVELGIPFSDPMADGPTIQAAANRALHAGSSVSKVLDMARQFRTKHANTPLILMGYYNPIYQYGLAQFAWDAQKMGVDGLIIVDLPPEEADELKAHLNSTDIAIIQLIAPTSLNTRLPTLLAHAQGYLYYVSVTGVTGAKSLNISQLRKNITLLKEQTDLPVTVGFGVRTPKQVSDISSLSDGVIVGSAIVDIIAQHATDATGVFVKEVSSFIQTLAKATSEKAPTHAGTV